MVLVPKVFAYRHQPLKALFLIYQAITTLLVRLPYWIVFNIPQSARPRQSWSLRKTVMVNLVRHLQYVSARSGDIAPAPDHLAIVHGPNVKGVWVEGIPENFIVGDVVTWARLADVQPMRLPGYWYDKPGSDIPIGKTPTLGEKVVYCLHGGGYTHLSANPKDFTANIPRGILEHSLASIKRAFTIEYRLSSTVPYKVANPFPAALLDALAGYCYLVSVVGFDPADIIVEGDSAGGNLALALTRYLVENKASEIPNTDLPPPPGSMILLSPWVDLGPTHDGPNSSLTKFKEDYLGDLNSLRGKWSKESFVGPHGMGAALSNRYISPASRHPLVEAHFTDFPRTFVVAGGAERLYDSIVTLKDKMVRDMGEGEGKGQVTYYEAQDAVHDWIPLVFFEPERTDTLQAIAQWL